MAVSHRDLGSDEIGKRECASLASEKPEFELVRRTLGEAGQRLGGPLKYYKREAT